MIGPFHHLSKALAWNHLDQLDAAILDVDVHGERVFPLAERLVQAGVPILFHTARPVDTNALAYAELCAKPVATDAVLQRLDQLILAHARARPAVAAG